MNIFHKKVLAQFNFNAFSIMKNNFFKKYIICEQICIILNQLNIYKYFKNINNQQNHNYSIR